MKVKVYAIEEKILDDKSIDVYDLEDKDFIDLVETHEGHSWSLFDFQLLLNCEGRQEINFKTLYETHYFRFINIK